MISATKRIGKDIRSFRDGNYEKQGIYCHFNDEDIYNVKAMIIGPEGCPYYNGYYLFDLTFPKDYPFNPPKVKFHTLQRGWRANPNLYECGKVCMSLINTWPGVKKDEQWTSCQNLITILISIQSMVIGVEHPVQNEPGWETETGKKSLDYNKITMYNNLSVAVLKMIIKTPPTYECFKDIMIDKFMENRYQFDKYIDSIKKYDNCVMKSSMYGMSCKFDINDLKNRMSYVYNTYIDQYNKRIETILKKVNESVEQISDTNNEEIKDLDLDEKIVNVDKCQKVKNEIKNMAKKKYQRKCPHEEAKQYDVGFEKLGISGVMYVVKQSEKGIKRWIKKK